MTDPNPAPADESADENLDTTDGQRDPLTTDDGLEAAAENMPAVPDDRDGDEDLAGNPNRGAVEAVPVETPELDITDDGTDPVADLAVPGDDKEG